MGLLMKETVQGGQKAMAASGPQVSLQQMLFLFFSSALFTEMKVVDGDID